MEKVQAPVVAGVSGAAILAAFLSFGGGGAKTPVAPKATSAVKSSETDQAERGTAPNQDGPWRAVCEEYAPNGVFNANPREIPRGYKVSQTAKDEPAERTFELSVGPDKKKHIHKITVHNQLIGRLQDCIPKAELSGIHFIIATVPDPDKTEMRLEFDRDIDALEKGAVATVHGFRFTGYWLPWNPRQSGSAPHKEEDVEAALLRTEQPGILLFHNDGGERLFLFIVGETPTSGIDRIQMVRAIRYWQELKKALRDQPSDQSYARELALKEPLMISGPHYSGSLSTLGEVLREGELLNSPVRIISPETSSPHLIKQFENDCSAPCEFRPLSLPSDQKDTIASRYLQHLGYKPVQIAELVEDESGFSTALSDPDTRREVIPDAYTHNEAIPLVLKFPRELSAVRSLSDQKSEQVAESGAKLLSLTRSTGDIKLAGQDSVEHDRPPTYAAEAEVSEISDALENDVRVLKGERIQCVIISATNPLDRAFLLEYLHDRLPNVRLAVEDADELEISHPHFVDLTGTIVISTLPTIPEVLTGGGLKSSHLSFNSIGSENQFLSVALLLDPSFDGYDRKYARYAGDAREHGWNVSLVGEEDFELIPWRNDTKKRTANLDSFNEPALLFGKEPPTQGPDNNIVLRGEPSVFKPRGFYFLSLVIFGVTLLHLVRFLNSERPSWWRNSLGLLLNANEDRPPKFAYVEPDMEQAFDRCFHLFALNNQIFLLNFLVLMVNPYASALVPFALTPLGLRATAGCAYLTVIVTGGLTLYLLGKFVQRLMASALSNHIEDEFTADDDSNNHVVLYALYLLMAVIYLFASIYFLCHWRAQNITEWRRVLALGNGLSPVWPIAAILSAWALWASLQLQRVRWICHREVNPVPPSQDLSLSDSTAGGLLCKDIQQIRASIDVPKIGFKALLLISTLFTFFVYTQRYSFSGIENGIWQDEGFGFARQAVKYFALPLTFRWWFGTWGVAAVLVTVVLTAYQVYRIWRNLARMLGRLELTRMKAAFEQIGEDDSIHIKLWDLGKSHLRFDEMTLIVKSLRKMKDKPSADKAQETMEKYLGIDLQGFQPTSGDRNALNQAINARMKDALDSLSKPIKTTDPRLALCWPDYIPVPPEELDRYLALRLTTLIRYVLLQMRNLMWFVIYGFFLAAISVALYPFQGGSNLSNMLGVTFAIVLVIMIALVTQILSSPMLKRLEDRGSNIGGFLQATFHLLTVGGLPILALLAWQFPWIGQIAFSWLRPLLSAVR